MSRLANLDVEPSTCLTNISDQTVVATSQTGKTVAMKIEIS
jgi:hypothetical protein